MRITLFTGNQRRHLALIHSLAERCGSLRVVRECTARPKFAENYFRRMEASEKKVFGDVALPSSRAEILTIPAGGLNDLLPRLPAAWFESDLILCFGCSFLKGESADRVIQRGALNIHLGVSPYYRGSACNFWAMHDGNFELVGATIHELSPALDAGGILFHAFPAPAGDPFDLGMLAVRAAFSGLLLHLEKGFHSLTPVSPDLTRQIRFSRKADFNEKVAAHYLSRLPASSAILERLATRRKSDFMRPYYGDDDLTGLLEKVPMSRRSETLARG